MCLDPASLTALTLAQASAAASAVGSVVSFIGQSQQASATDQQNAIIRQQLLDEQDRARMDGQRAAQQQYEKDAAETNAYAQEHNRTLATARALLGESGGGVSSDRALSAIGVQSGQDLATLSKNATNAQSEISLGTAASVNATGSKFASIKAAEKPSLLGLGLTLAGTGLKYGSDVKRINSPKGT